MSRLPGGAGSLGLETWEGTMRRTFIVAAIAAGVVGTTIAAVAVVGIPEIDQANVTMRLTSKPFVPKTCDGEDGITYRTYRGTWKGAEVEVTPGLTDYDLNGPLTVARVEWTINLKTQRGVLTGTATLRAPGGGTARTYAGPLTLITQGLPNPDRAVAARGWLDAATFTGGVADGGSVLANVELKIDGAFAASGGFGNAAPLPGTPSFSVTTVNRTC